ncbi:MAG: hypothetical protein LBT40_04380, partial [Deltaproteobacteria bacterium]|nr:hypothetical protein [Deltaproteobacteria bacterium]
MDGALLPAARQQHGRPGRGPTGHPPALKSFTSHKVLGDILKEQKKLSQANAAYEVADMIKLSQNKKE